MGRVRGAGDAFGRFSFFGGEFMLAATIADTDWIVVLDNGVVHEQVTQAELLVRPSGLFHQLYKLQTAGRTHP